MGDMGLQGAYGAAGAADALRQIIRDRLIQKQQEFENARQTANDARLAEEHAANMADRQAATMRGIQNERDTAAGKALPNLGVGTAVEAPDFARTYAGTASAPNFTPERTLPATQTAGGMPLPGGGTGDGEGVEPNQAGVQKTTEAPRQITGRMVSMGTDKQRGDEEQKTKRGQLMMSLPPGSRERLALEYEDATGKSPAAGMFDPKPKGGEVKDTPNGLVRIGDDNTVTPVVDANGKPVKAYHQPTQSPDQKLTKVEHKDAVTGRTVIEWLPQGELRGKTFQKGTGAAAEQRLASAQAVNQTGNDIVRQLSDPKVAAVLGPAMGRYNSVQEWLGNPPPELAELAGQIESYAMATMGVHGMRSTVGAEKIKEMLSAKHTPESLVQKIKGLSAFSNHLMQNEGRSGAPSGGAAAPSAGRSGIKSITEIK